jgi:hypothetical protein
VAVIGTIFGMLENKGCSTVNTADIVLLDTGIKQFIGIMY